LGKLEERQKARPVLVTHQVPVVCEPKVTRIFVGFLTQLVKKVVWLTILTCGQQAGFLDWFLLVVGWFHGLGCS
jgi:hypothetical protein